MTKSIGSGSYGQVFLGRWRADEVAIKVVTLESGHSSEASTAAFIHEVRTWLFLGSASRHATRSVGSILRYVLCSSWSGVLGPFTTTPSLFCLSKRA